MNIVPIVTIDGPAGVGKTTLARRVAAELGIAYLDTGAMFRCLALKLGPNAENLSAQERIQECAQWHFSLHGQGDATELHCNGVPIGNEIRNEAVGMMASKLGTFPEVRQVLKEAQRRLGDTSLVAEGRDMGSVVFATARYKFFLDASPMVRALRRVRDLEERGERPDIETIAEQIRHRDEQDRNRAIAPLCAAKDAVSIDTSDLNIEEVLSEIVRHIRLGSDFSV